MSELPKVDNRDVHAAIEAADVSTLRALARIHLGQIAGDGLRVAQDVWSQAASTCDEGESFHRTAATIAQLYRLEQARRDHRRQVALLAKPERNPGRPDASAAQDGGEAS